LCKSTLFQTRNGDKMTFCHFTEKIAAVALRAALLLCILVLIIVLSALWLRIDVFY